jgi:hypothetical protein
MVQGSSRAAGEDIGQEGSRRRYRAAGQQEKHMYQQLINLIK